MELTAKQSADYRRLRGYFPYRMFFLVDDPRDPQSEAVIWAMRDKRQVNRVIREGGTVLRIS